MYDAPAHASPLISPHLPTRTSNPVCFFLEEFNRQNECRDPSLARTGLSLDTEESAVLANQIHGENAKVFVLVPCVQLRTSTALCLRGWNSSLLEIRYMTRSCVCDALHIIDFLCLLWIMRVFGCTITSRTLSSLLLVAAC
jgi:hypothetical protein